MSIASSLSVGSSATESCASFEVLTELVSGFVGLPRIPVVDWAQRAAAACVRPWKDAAATVAFLRPATSTAPATVVHSGAACSSQSSIMLPSLRWRATEPLIRSGVPLPTGVATLESWRTNEHPFDPALTSRGEIVRSLEALRADLVLVSYVWRAEDGVEPAALQAGFRMLAAAAQRLLPPGDGEIAWLSERETEVLDLIVEGYPVPEIARRFCRSPHTVHDHVKSIHRKTGASTRGELVAAALRGVNRSRPAQATPA